MEYPKVGQGIPEQDPKELHREKLEVHKKLAEIELRLHEVRAIMMKWGDLGDRKDFDQALGAVVNLMHDTPDDAIRQRSDKKGWPDELIL